MLVKILHAIALVTACSIIAISVFMITIITQTEMLRALCERLSTEAYVTVDSEFIRDKTYYPQLCLLQIAGQEEAVLIDPLAQGIDLQPLFDLMQNEAVVKVFHAARQDLEIIYMLSGAIPTPLYDTQVAAAVCGYGESVGYETLVNTIVNERLDKSSRFTDWSKRPLSDQQQHYALADVTHLRVIYDHLKQQIDAAGRSRWIDEEHTILLNPDIYEVPLDQAWQRLKYGNMRPKNLAVLREIAAWREQTARDADVPRGRVVRDDILVEIAGSMPRSESELLRLRGVDGQLSKARKQAIVEAVLRALELPSEQYPRSKKKVKFSENITSAVAMLQLLLKVQTDVHDIASSMIANKDDLQAIALGHDTPALHGWRGDVFGAKAQALMQGKLKLSLDAKSKQVVFEDVA